MSWSALDAKKKSEPGAPGVDEEKLNFPRGKKRKKDGQRDASQKLS